MLFEKKDETPCLVCGSPKRTNPVVNRDMVSKERFFIDICQECHLGRTRVGKDFDAAKYYPASYYGKKNKRFNLLMETLIKFFRYLRTRLILKHANGKKGKILDVGCGRGLMLAQLRKRGWDCCGTEFSETSSEHARSVLHLSVSIHPGFNFCDFEDESFDVVTLWHLLEHVADPVKIFSEVTRVLKPGGLLIVEVPNFQSLQSRIRREDWIYLEAPRHLFHFSRESLVSLMTTNGFSIRRTNTFSWEYGFFGMIQGVFNLFLPQKNFLYLVLRNRHSHFASMKGKDFFLNFILLVLLGIPVFLISIFLEMGASIFQQGGCLRVIAYKK